MESSELMLLVKALQEQTKAINQLVESNARLTQALMEVAVEGEDIEPQTYLSGKPR